MTPCGVAGMAIHLGPSVARRLMRPTRGLGSAPLPPPTFPPTGAPSYLALLRVEFARFTPNGGSRRRSASSLWHWSSPHGGRALPATLRCGARTFLTPPTGHPTDDARPSDRLADRAIVQRSRRQAQLACCGATSNVIEPPLPSKIIRPAGSIETDDAPCMAPMNRPSVAAIAGSRQAIAVEPIWLNLMAPRAYS